ncbi:MAG: hypothetical protein HY238_08095, partial [Acidobacteria bacterium]|nr:hypothetical protein [Acidobacteriota bacterium]
MANALAFSPDGQLLAIGCEDRSIRIYRGLPDERSGTDRTRMRKLIDQPVTGNSYTIRGPGLVNGRPQTYAVAPIYASDSPRNAGRRPVHEGARAILQAIPIAVPEGWPGSSVNEGLKSGSAAFDPATGHLLLRCWGNRGTDGHYFLRQQVDGDFQVTVKVLSWPYKVHWDAAGLELRESLDARSRYVVLVPDRALGRSWRDTIAEAVSSEGTFPAAEIKLPITLRLTRRGSAVAAEYSRDDGKTFQP